MAITFPASPTNGQTFTSGNKTWQWDGTTWLAYGASLSPTVLKVDSANARVGVNNQSPAYALDVNGTIEGTQFIQGTDYLSPYQGFRNKIINGDFRINQRGFTSSTTSATYGFDRWLFFASGGTVTYSTQSFTVGSPAATGYEAEKFARLVSAGQSGTGDIAVFQQRIEDVRTFANSTVTVSFFAKAASGTPKVTVELAQVFGTGGSPSADVNNYVGQVTLSTSWTRYSVTINVPNINGKTIGTNSDSILNVNLWISAGSSYNARLNSIGIQNNTFDFWGVQVERGSVATPFEQRPLQTELALCQRYYEKSYDLNTVPGTALAAGWVNGSHISTAVTTSYIGLGFTYKVSKRATPTVTIYDPNGNINACQRWTLGASNNNGQNIVVDSSSGQNNVLVYSSGSTSNAGIGFHFVSVSEL